MRRLPSSSPIGAVSLAPLLLVLLLPLLAGCPAAEEEGSGEGERPPVLVDVVPVEQRTVAVEVRATGSLEATDRVTIAPEIAGRVSELPFEEGSRVEEGARLAVLDPTTQERVLAEVEAAHRRAAASVERAEATLDRLVADRALARANFERKRTLFEDGHANRATFDEARASLDRAEAAVREGEASVREAEAARAEAEAALGVGRDRLSRHVLTAPFAGMVGQRIVSRGAYVRAGDPIVELLQVRPIEATVTVPERYLPGLRSGLDLIVRMAGDEAVGGRVERVGRVAYVEPSVDRSSRSVVVKARFPNEDGVLRPGAFVDATLVLARRVDALVIPEAAVIPRGDRLLAYVVADGVAHRREVVVGERLPGHVEVREGLEAGETVVVGGLQKIVDGARVRTREGGPPDDDGPGGAAAGETGGTP